MNCGSLIAEVHLRPALWDSKHRDYHNRALVEKHWEDLSSIVGMSAIDCRKKWKYMRDRYRAELKKMAATESKSSWIYFDQMLFVRLQLGRKYKSGQVMPDLDDDSSSAPKVENHAENNEFSDNETLEDDFNENSIEEFQSINQPQPKKSKRKNEDIDPFLGIEDKRKHKSVNVDPPVRVENKEAEVLPIFRAEKESDDLLFFKSLLGFMKDFSPLRRLRIRDKIQKIIMEELSSSEEIQQA